MARSHDLFDPDRFLRSAKDLAIQYTHRSAARIPALHRRGVRLIRARRGSATIMQTLELRMPEREQNRREPRSVARGIAVARARDHLDVIDRQPVAVTGRWKMTGRQLRRGTDDYEQARRATVWNWARPDRYRRDRPGARRAADVATALAQAATEDLPVSVGVRRELSWAASHRFGTAAC